MKVLSLSTTIFSAFLAASSLARAAASSGVEATRIEHEEEKQVQIKTPEKLYLRQNPLVHPNDLIATSDSDAAGSSTTADPNDLIATSDSDAADSSTTTTTAQWLFEDEQEEIELSQNGTSTGGGGINWRVDGFGFYETIFVSCFAAYLVVIKVLWNTFIMKPMKLIAVFVHGKFSM